MNFINNQKEFLTDKLDEKYAANPTKYLPDFKDMKYF